MPRKKATKSRVSKTNRQALSLSENMENDFRAIPNKLPAQFNKELAGLKKEESKLHASLLKMQKQQTAAKKKHAALTLKSKNNLTAALKKQLKATQKAYDVINDAALKLATQLSDIKQHGKLLSQKKAKFTAVCKYMTSLDKEWEAKNSKSTKAKTIQAKKPRKKVKRAASPTHQAPSKIEPIIIDEMTPEMADAT